MVYYLNALGQSVLITNMNMERLVGGFSLNNNKGLILALLTIFLLAVSSKIPGISLLAVPIAATSTWFLIKKYLVNPPPSLPRRLALILLVEAFVIIFSPSSNTIFVFACLIGFWVFNLLSPEFRVSSKPQIVNQEIASEQQVQEKVAAQEAPELQSRVIWPENIQHTVQELTQKLPSLLPKLKEQKPEAQTTQISTTDTAASISNSVNDFGANSVVARLEKAKNLFEQKLITESEYAEIKRDIIKEI